MKYKLQSTVPRKTTEAQGQGAESTVSYTGLEVAMGYTDPQRWRVGSIVDCRGPGVGRQEHYELQGPRDQGAPP